MEGEPAILAAFSEVLKSDVPSFSPGDKIIGTAPAAEYSVVPPELVLVNTVLPAGLEGIDPPKILTSMNQSSGT